MNYAKIMRGQEWALAIIIVAPLLVKVHLLCGVLQADPILFYSGLESSLNVEPLLGRRSTIDPNIAFTSQALGYRAALDVISGQLPWWNHFEAVGAPLAGGMQSAALFPLTPLLLIDNGQLYLHITLQVIAGLATFALMRAMDVARLAALGCALLFEFNGTFAWLGNAPVNPVAFLPLMLLGVERTRNNVINQGCCKGWFWIAIGLSLSLYAGFPEVAYLNGLFVGAWTLARAIDLPRGLITVFLGRAFAGALCGLLLAAPIVIAFLDYLPHAHLGGHDGTALSWGHLDSDFLLALFLPYFFGLIHETEGFWSDIGGYAGLIVTILAVAGVFGSRYRILRLFLLAWVVASWSITYGVLGTDHLAGAVPGLKLIPLYRYLPPSWEFALAVLAGLALDDLVRAGAPGRSYLLSGIVATTVLVVMAFYISSSSASEWALHSMLFAGLLTGSLIVTLLLPLGKTVTAVTLSAIAITEALIYFVLPTFANPKAAAIEMRGVEFLQENLDHQRFYTLGPISPNYGSYFGIAQINHNDIPIPRDWVNFVHAFLDDNTRAPSLFVGDLRRDAEGNSATSNLLRNLEAFRKVGVKYVVTHPGVQEEFKRDGGALDGTWLKQVYADKVMAIYELFGWSPYFSAERCTMEIATRDRLNAKCSSVSKLVRLELFMPGWRAQVNGENAPITRTNDLFQEIELPLGLSQIEYKFQPPHIRIGYVAFLLGFLWLAVAGIKRGVRPIEER